MLTHAPHFHHGQQKPKTIDFDSAEDPLEQRRFFRYVDLGRLVFG
jgi:hypothetical protein